MRRAERLFRIIQHLRDGRLVTAAQLAERMEVAERTIYRDIADMKMNGVPIDGERGVGYIMRAGFDLPPLMFTSDELKALTVGALLVRAWGGNAMSDAIEQALAKIEAVLPSERRGAIEPVAIHAPGYEMAPKARAMLDQFNRAITERQLLSLDYRDANGKPTTRDVEPLALWFWGKVWTLIAWCRLRRDFRMFRVDRVISAQTGPVFEQATGRTLADFHKMLEDACIAPGQLLH